jgi:prepilin-type N-terminal cleavage/methylation domain-containing protein
MRNQKGFTLVELVVVVMILGILAAVAAPKLLGTSSTASENGLKQTLAVVRDAIERHAAEKGGTLPRGDNETNFKADLAPYLRGTFPVCPVGGTNSKVKLTTTPGDITGTSATPTEGWHYSSVTGEFICNSTANTKSEPGVTYDSW